MLPQVQDHLTGYPEKQKILLSRSLRGLSYLGLVCHAEPTSPWYHFKENRFARVDQWLTGIHPERLDEAQAQRDLLLKYLRGYGPASVWDFAYWAGFKITDAKKIFDAIKDKLVETKIKNIKRPFWVLREDLESLRDAIKEKVPMRFLPEFDPLIMRHKDKTRILNDEHRKKIFLPLADVTPTILIDGRITGTWSFKVSDRKLTTSLFKSMDSNSVKKLTQESGRLSQFFGSD